MTDSLEQYKYRGAIAVLKSLLDEYQFPDIEEPLFLSFLNPVLHYFERYPKFNWGIFL
ncbi:MAG: hypothetical protein HC769_23725 [Cyanobacteria bacterium CRU_2_1]|nr:hypothetical protein [Cyanobacteria bacterium RU_5_0]NJR61578.1 hypothetical protein [Cyanobacteria bacterium CRU_2_1]